MGSLQELSLDTKPINPKTGNGLKRNAFLLFFSLLPLSVLPKSLQGAGGKVSRDVHTPQQTFSKTAAGEKGGENKHEGDEKGGEKKHEVDEELHCFTVKWSPFHDEPLVKMGD